MSHTGSTKTDTDTGDILHKLLDVHKNSMKICGLYGMKDNNLVEPSDPECDLVVVCEVMFAGKVIYNIDVDEFYMYSNPNQCTSGLKRLSDVDGFSLDEDKYKQKIKEYLESEEVVVSKENHSWFDFKNVALPLIRRAYPKMITENLISVQPMTAPAGLSTYLKAKK